MSEDTNYSNVKIELPGKETSVGQDKEANVSQKPLYLDDVLSNELGEFGWFQKRNIIVIALPVIICGMMTEYIFSAAAIPHRCRIPECSEEDKLVTYDPVWLNNAIPKTSSGLASCQRYAPYDTASNGTLYYCPASLFNQSKIIDCEGFVYARDNTVVYELESCNLNLTHFPVSDWAEILHTGSVPMTMRVYDKHDLMLLPGEDPDFDLGCEEWLRALAGTMYSTGTLLVMPVAGYISDRFGRRLTLVISIFNFGVFGLLRAFSVNYTMYLALQLLQSTFGGGAYTSAFILVTELVGPRYRVTAGAILISLFAIGEIILGGVAWLISSWRYMIMAIHIPCFFIIFFYWRLSESVRWLLSKKKHTEAKNILDIVARLNKTNISEKSLEALMNPPQASSIANNDEKPELVRRILRSPILLRRICTTPIWWITATVVYYGLSINSTGLSDSTHLNYILTCAIEIPGYFTAVFVLDRFGRKATLSSGFIFSAACNIAFVFIPHDYTIARLIIYLLGKYGISMVATSVYLFTSELYPTEFRHTLLAFSSMIGRIGSIAAPLTPVLTYYWHGIPSMLFGVLGIISGLLVLTQPETLGTKMPDTLADAEAIGKSSPQI